MTSLGTPSTVGAAKGLQIRVLLVAACPRGLEQAGILEELQVLRSRLERHQPRIAVEVCLATTLSRFWDQLSEWPHREPGVHRIVHFVGHGDADGFQFVDEKGDAASADAQALCELLERLGVATAVFNICYSAEVYSGLSIPWGVLMKGRVGGDGARLFAEAFYQAISQGLAVPEAFERGKLKSRFAKLAVDATLVANLREPEPEPARAPAPPTESPSWLGPDAAEHETGFAVAMLASRNGDHAALLRALGPGARLDEAKLNQALRSAPAILRRLARKDDAFVLWQRVHDAAIASFRGDESSASTGLRLGPGGLWLSRIDSADHELWLSIHPLTRREYAALTGDARRASRAALAPWVPATGLSWYEVESFIEGLNVKHAGSGRYRLPTIEEWQLAARDLTDVPSGYPLRTWGWLGAEAPTAVGLHRPNRYGLLDLIGNVAEWTETGASAQKAVCGGSYRDRADSYSVCEVESLAPSQRGEWIGVRLAWEERH